MWHEVCGTDEVENGDSRTVFAGGESIAVFRYDGEFYAVSDACTHTGGSVSEGGVRDGVVRCPRHGAPFDIRTGEALGYPAGEDLCAYTTKVEQGTVYVSVE